MLRIKISIGPIPTLAANAPMPGTMRVAGVNNPTIIKDSKKTRIKAAQFIHSVLFERNSRILLKSNINL